MGFLACQEGHVKVVQILCAAGAKKDKATRDGATPLLMASQQNHAAVVRLLCHEGVNKDQAKKDGGTSIAVASQQGHREVVELLCDLGADLDKPTRWRDALVRCLPGGALYDCAAPL